MKGESALKKTALLLPLLLAVLCACAVSPTMDLSGYFAARDRLGSALPMYGLYQTGEETGVSYCLPLSDRLTLRFLAEESGALYECRVLLRMMEPNGAAFVPDGETRNAFLAECAAALRAFCGVDAQTAEVLLQSLAMTDGASYGKTGTLTARTGHCAVRFQSHPLEAAFSVRNEELRTLESGSPPESRPLFGDTTATRKETVPHR